jgi:hypothetical protein
MTMQPETHEPNEEGFAGDPSTPEPEPDRRPADEVVGESIAVPAGDLTGALSEAIEDVSGSNDEDSPTR